jgi:hypothetical protein
MRLECQRRKSRWGLGRRVGSARRRGPATRPAKRVAVGDSHHQADAKWMVLRRPLWGHNDTPCGKVSLIDDPNVRPLSTQFFTV